MARARTTTDHDEIRAWVDERGGWPARVKRMGRRPNGATIALRIDFPGYSGEELLQHMSWGDWFDAFEDSKMAFSYEAQVPAGEENGTAKIVPRRAPVRSRRATTRSAGAPKRGAARRLPKRAAKLATKRGATTKRGAAPKRGARTKQTSRKSPSRRRTSRARAT